MRTLPGIWFPGIYEATKNQRDISTIDRLNILSQVDFANLYASKSIPFLLNDPFPVLQQSEILAILSRRLGSFVLSVRFGDMSNPDNYFNRRTVDMPLADFLDNHFLRTPINEAAYAANNIISDDFLDALGISYPAFYPATFFNKPRLWMGRAGTVTQLHKDIPDNFSFNYFGKKRWIIYPPKDFPYLYMVNPHEKELPDFGASLVNLKSPDYAKYPDFLNARGIEFIQEPGDMLYLPAGWSHYVENLEATLVINFWLLRENSPAILKNDK